MAQGGSLLGDIGKSIFKTIGNKVVDGLTSSGQDLVGSLGDKAKAKLFGSGEKRGKKNQPHSKMAPVQFGNGYDDMDGGVYNTWSAYRQKHGGKKQTNTQMKEKYHEVKHHSGEKAKHHGQWKALEEDVIVHRHLGGVPEGLQAYHNFAAEVRASEEYEKAPKGKKQGFLNRLWDEHKAGGDPLSKLHKLHKQAGSALYMP